MVAKLRNADPFVTGKGLIDTGASKTCISKKAATELELKSVGTIQVGGVGGTEDRSLFERQDTHRVAKRLLSRLTDREREVIELRFNDDCTLQNVADRFGRFRERIRQIEALAFEKMARRSRTEFGAEFAG